MRFGKEDLFNLNNKIPSVFLPEVFDLYVSNLSHNTKMDCVKKRQFPYLLFIIKTGIKGLTKKETAL